MPTTYNGQGSIPFPTVGPGTRVQITNATNTAPIVCTTATAHGFNTGDTIRQEGILGNVAANGLFQIAVTGASTYQLLGTSGTGAYTSGGYAIDYEIQPAIRIPNPGEAASMVTLGPVLEGLANPIPMLYEKCGTYRLVESYFGLYQNTPPYAMWATTTYASVTSPNFTIASGTTVTAQYLLGTASIPYFGPNDIIDLEVTFSAATDNMQGMWMGASVIQSSTSLAFGGIQCLRNDSLYSAGSYGGLYQPFACRMTVPCSILNPLLPTSFGVGIQMSSTGSNSGHIYLYGPYTVNAHQYRLN